MNGQEHYRAAERLVQHSVDHTDQGNAADDKIAELSATQAQVHALLALVDHVREIGDQLDTLPRESGILTDENVMRCPHGAVICGLCGYGVPPGSQS